jgi:hypothetical protein
VPGDVGVVRHSVCGYVALVFHGATGGVDGVGIHAGRRRAWCASSSLGMIARTVRHGGQAALHTRVRYEPHQRRHDVDGEAEPSADE